MTIHFEELWERCEQLHQETGEQDVASLIDEIMMKFHLYKMIETNKEIPDEERQKVKSRTMGEILLALTNLSLREGINVFDALGTAYNYRAIKHYSQKHEP